MLKQYLRNLYFVSTSEKNTAMLYRKSLQNQKTHSCM